MIELLRFDVSHCCATICFGIEKKKKKKKKKEKKDSKQVIIFYYK